MSARVREALRADSSTTQYADRIAINMRRGVVTLRGVVDDLMDSDNLLAVAEFVEGVEEVVDELEVRGIE
jgi:osmotically-inducible protein OsmY